MVAYGAMKHSTERILTTHAGSLPRPDDLLDLIQTPGVDRGARAARVRSAVADIVRTQLDLGLDIVDDGEMSKPSFVTYVHERLAGFEPSREPAGLPWAGSRRPGCRVRTIQLGARYRGVVSLGVQVVGDSGQCRDVALWGYGFRTS